MQAARGNVYAYAASALNAHAAWNIDWGGNDGGMQESRGHRKAVMALDGEYTNVGLAAVAETDPATGVGPFVVTGNYAQAANAPDHYNRFLVGTVWTDQNGNNFYDLGEGIGNVTVVPEGSAYFAITSASGGYAIPITTPGTYQVRFFNPSGAVDTVRTVTVTSTSALLDLVYAP
jgi:hypothetical protein